MVTSGGGNAAQSNGGDIRFSSDINGTTQLACEIVQWTQNATPSSAVAEIWVPISILTGSDVTIYVWYNAGGSQSQPAANASFGSQAVWDSNYKIVEHFGDGTTLSVNDSTSNANNATNHSGAATAGKFGGGVNFPAATNYFSFAAGAPSGANARTIEWWVKTSSSGTGVFYDQGVTSTGQRNLLYTPSTQHIFFDINGGNLDTLSGTTRDGSWHCCALSVVSDIHNSHIYIDGVDEPLGSAALAMNTAATPIYLNSNVDGNTVGQVGSYDEFRISNIVRSTSWLNSTYNTQSSPGTFTIAGTPTGTGGGGGNIANPLGGVNPLQGFIL